MRFIIVFLLLTCVGLAKAADDVTKELVRRDKAACDAAADSRYTWITDMTNWRRAYNVCLRRRLRDLGNRYVPITVEAMRLEEQCQSYMMNQTPVELSMLGIQIAAAYNDREMETQATSRRLEQTLELYHDRTRQSVHRIRELRTILGN